MEAPRVHPAALKRKYTERDILHALKHVHIDRDVVDGDPPRTWVFGFAPDGTLLEMIVLRMSWGGLVIHCMKARKQELEKALKARGRY